jgi:hypothetical protein
MQMPFLSLNLVVVAMVSASLSACGGSDESASLATSAESSTPAITASPSPATPQPSAQAACSPNGSFTYSGSASQVASSNGTLAVVVVPTLPVAYQMNRNFTASAAPASSQVQQASGAFTTLASSAAATDCLGLEHGKVTDIQGIGSDVAIGRWNEAMDTDGNTYNSVQGVHYAVGTPLSLTASSGTLACTQQIADTVASDDGGLSGTLSATSATLDLATRTLNNVSMSINLGNTNYTLTNTQAPMNGTSTTGQLSLQSVVVGHDATQPLVALGYSATLPNIGGVVVLSCK